MARDQPPEAEAHAKRFKKNEDDINALLSALAGKNKAKAEQERRGVEDAERVAREQAAASEEAARQEIARQEIAREEIARQEEAAREERARADEAARQEEARKKAEAEEEESKRAAAEAVRQKRAREEAAAQQKAREEVAREAHIREEEAARKETERLDREKRVQEEKKAQAAAKRANDAREKQALKDRIEQQAKDNAEAEKQLNASQAKQADLTKQAELRKKLKVPVVSRAAQGLAMRQSKHPQDGPSSRSNHETQANAARERRQSIDDDVLFVPERGTSKTPLHIDTTTTGLRSLPASAIMGSNFRRPSNATTKPTIPAKRPSSPGVSSSKQASTTPRVPKKAKTSMSATQSPQIPDSQIDSAGPSDNDRTNGPEWYRALKKDNTRKQGRDGAVQGQVDVLLAAFRDNIKKAKAAHERRENLSDHFAKIRLALHKLFFLDVKGKTLRNNYMLHGKEGMAQLFDASFADGVDWPYDIKSDAEELYNKWCRQEFDTDIMRGMIIGLAGGQANDRVEQCKKRNARFHGNGDLLNGQWWPTQLTALRDGAHGESQAGICGTVGQGAYSVLMARGQQYEQDNEDHGDVVLYCGTDSNKQDENGIGEVSDNTKLLLENIQNKKPVRLLRSSEMVNKEWAPQFGFRYDGLYDVTSYEEIDPPTSKRRRHRFKLVRQAGQDPIRGGEGPHVRPTDQEIEAYQKHKKLARGK